MDKSTKLITISIAILLVVILGILFLSNINSNSEDNVNKEELKEKVWKELPEWAVELGIELPPESFTFIEDRSVETTLEDNGFNSFAYFYSGDVSKATGYIEEMAAKLNLVKKDNEPGSGILIQYDNAGLNEEGIYIIYNISSDKVLRVSALNTAQMTESSL